jgi:DNA-binding MarR family transcriptional regulator
MTNEPSKRSSGLRHPGVLAWLRLMRVFLKVDGASARHFEAASARHFEAWKPKQPKLSTAQFDVLAHIGAAEGITQQELAESLFVTKGNISQLLDRMERLELVRRCQEGRANTLFLTDQGRRLFDELVPAQEALIAELFASLSAAEQVQLLALLRKLDQALE